jgi:hypothetical protein
VPFRGISVGAFFAAIDVYVYFTAATWRESFGRVIAEAIAAGKLVITDPETARSFGEGVIGAKPCEVDRIVAHHLASPSRYLAQVRLAQAGLDRFSAARFSAMFMAETSMAEIAA